MIKTVLFDAIDTLFCAYPDKIEMYRRVIKEFAHLDVSRSEMTRVWDSIVTTTEDEAARGLGGNKSLAWDNFNVRILELLDYKGNLNLTGRKILFETWSNPGNFTLYDDVIPALDLIKNFDKVIACLSNEDRNLENFFTYFNIKPYFDHIITSEEVGAEKPNKLIFLAALQKTKSKPEETIYVGDSLVSDYYGAKNAGLLPILIDRDDKIGHNVNINRIKSLSEIISFLQE